MDRAAIRRFYVAISCPESKLATLMELLTALQHDHTQEEVTGRTTGAAAVVCCSSRDNLDLITTALLAAPELFTVLVLHSDMTDKEREAQVSLLKQATSGKPAPSSSRGEASTKTEVESSSQKARTSSSANDDLGLQKQQRQRQDSQTEGLVSLGQNSTVVLVTTDTCLKAVPKDLMPLGVPLLVQFDLARQKEAYLKRIFTVFGGGKERRNAAGRSIVIDFVAAGEVAAFRASEAWFTGTIQEVPVHVSDIFQSAG